MHKTCSKCGLVNWPDAVLCRRCGTRLSQAIATDIPRVIGKEAAREIKIKADDDLEYEGPNSLIRNGFVAGIICAILSYVVVTLVKISFAIPSNLFGTALIEMGIGLALSIGIHFKSRVCAGLLLAFYTVGKIALLYQGQFAFIGIFTALFFLNTIYQGLQGTIQYHRIQERKMRRVRA